MNIPRLSLQKIFNELKYVLVIDNDIVFKKILVDALEKDGFRHIFYPTNLEDSLKIIRKII